jgi:hypothetical protein
VHHKSKTTAKVLESSPPNISFRRDLFGSRLVSWNALIQRLDFVELVLGMDEYQWNLHENGIFFADSM